MSPTLFAVRMIGSLVLGAASFLFVMMLVMYASDVERRVEKDRGYFAVLRQCAAIVEQRRQADGKLPTTVDLDGCGHGVAGSPHSQSPETMQVYVFTNVAQLMEDERRQLRAIPAGQFIVTFWRGEWYDYYAPWSGKTSLILTPDEYRERIAPSWEFIFWALVLAIGSYWLWPLKWHWRSRLASA